jgi:hypothetical protein
VVADEDVDALDAQVGRGARGWSRSGHGEIIRGAEGCKKRITQRKKKADPWLRSG